jgi:hypothetical protein
MLGSVSSARPILDPVFRIAALVPIWHLAARISTWTVVFLGILSGFLKISAKNLGSSGLNAVLILPVLA